MKATTVDNSAQVIKDKVFSTNATSQSIRYAERKSATIMQGLRHHGPKELESATTKVNDDESRHHAETHTCTKLKDASGQKRNMVGHKDHLKQARVLEY
jgi:hypothetical protein